MTPEKEDKLIEKIDDIHRALYGDAANKVEGIVDKVDNHDKILFIPSFVMRNPKWAIPLFVFLVFAVMESGHRGINFVLSFLTK